MLIQNINNSRSFHRDWQLRRILSAMSYTVLIIAVMLPTFLSVREKNPGAALIGIIVGIATFVVHVLLSFYYASKRIQDKNSVIEVEISDGKILVRSDDGEKQYEEIFNPSQAEYKPKFLYRMYFLLTKGGDIILKKDDKIVTISYLIFNTRQLAQALGR